MAENVSFSPTKSLFIDVLTRDISLKDCILDLLDNSVDSYTRKGITETRNISLTISENIFEIIDYCGGISKQDLLNEVFRFGMTDEDDHKNTIGVYGIGLKRAIFKIGNDIIFETDDGTDYCNFRIDVPAWLASKEWGLPLTVTHKSALNGGKPYTKITISNLRDETKDRFRTTAFVGEIKDGISIYYSMFINSKKLSFTVNNEKLIGYEIKIFASNDYKPVKYEETYNNVAIRIICWLHVSEQKILPSGWNVYMNDRLIILDDTTKETGWTGDKAYLPQYHNIFNQFRGIVFLETNEPNKLPMNTSKNGFNKDSQIYHYLLIKMCEVARPIINYLSNKYNVSKSESDDKEEQLSANISADSGSQMEPGEYSLTETTYKTNFTPPVIKTPIKKDGTIQYIKPKEKIAIAKKILNVKANWEVGSKTFDYFWDTEGLDDNK